MELYIIRHGETDWNIKKRLQGNSDIELNDYGRKLAQITADALRDIEFDCIYSSPLKRAYETAKIIRMDRNIEIITDDRLKEMCFGAYEGCVTTTLPEEFWYFFDEPLKFKPAPGGETYAKVVKRAESFINDVVVPNSEKYKTMLVVAHGALNKALMITLNHQGIEDYWSGVFQKNCCVNIFEVNGTDFKQIQNGRIYYDDEGGNNYR